ncbi:hypothetical protein PLICRDRAFT_174170 [Plicaturopsis crispa FD-325 SS-3]|nr:hypothetical protein PLICRDRAFT_174170 [Plicaturopsis crispa FD-325 SS-3]
MQRTENSASRKTLDKEIARLIRTVYQLRKRRNTRVPIGRLPTEILADIFLYARRNWNGLSRTCSHWRRVATQLPELWAPLVDPYANKMWTLLLLTVRAPDAPIKLDFDAAVWDYERHYCAVVFPHATRAYELRINGHPDEMQDITLGIGGPMPLLRYLTVKLLDLQQAPFVIPDWFCSSTPKLEYVSLSGCAATWDRPLFGGLQHLIIAHPAGWGDHAEPQRRLSWSQLLNVLSANPALRWLELTDALRGGSPGPGTEPEYPPVSMPHLEGLKLMDSDLSTGLFFLRHVRLPLSTVFIASWDISGEIDGLLSDALAAFQGTGVQFTRSISVGPRSVTNIITSIAFSCVSGTIVPLPLPEQASRGDFEGLILGLTLRATPAILQAQVLPTLFERLPLPRLVYLEMLVTEVLPAEVWARILAPVPWLQELFVHGYVVEPYRGLFSALSAAAGPVVAPALNTLGFLIQDNFDGVSAAELQQSLTSRRARHKELERLAFIECTGDDGRPFNANIFQSLVGRIEVKSVHTADETATDHESEADESDEANNMVGENDAAAEADETAEHNETDETAEGNVNEVNDNDRE